MEQRRNEPAHQPRVRNTMATFRAPSTRRIEPKPLDTSRLHREIERRKKIERERERGEHGSRINVEYCRRTSNRNPSYPTEEKLATVQLVRADVDRCQIAAPDYPADCSDNLHPTYVCLVHLAAAKVHSLSSLSGPPFAAALSR